MIQIDTHELIIRTLKSDVPVDIRLRRVLKSLLRSYRFKCISIKPVVQTKTKAARAVKRKAKTNGEVKAS